MKGSDKSRLRHEVENLTKGKRLAFALLLCERMFPVMEKFSREENFDSSIYRGGLNAVWHYLENGERSSNYSDAANQCLDHAPDTEEFNHPLTSAALNAALSITATIRFLLDDDINHIVEVAGLALDTVALYAQAVGNTPPRSLGFDEIMKHPLVQQELQQQVDDLKFLQALPIDVSQRTIPIIKERAAITSTLIPIENKR